MNQQWKKQHDILIFFKKPIKLLINNSIFSVIIDYIGFFKIKNAG